MKASISPTNKKVIYKISAAAFWILIWEALAVSIGSELIIASPVRVAQHLIAMLAEASTYKALGFSLIRICIGFLSALILGTAAAVMSSRFSFVKALLAPITSVIKSTPVASFIILAIIWFGSRNLSVFISFLMVFPIVYLNLLNGIESLDKDLTEMARTYSVSRFKSFIYVYIPQLMPFITSACSSALGLAWKSGVAAEVIGISQGSIGERLYRAKLYFETGELLAWTAIIITASASIEKLVMLGLSVLSQKINGRYSREYVKKRLETEKKRGAAPSPQDIKINSVSKSFDNQEVLKNFSAVIKAKEHIAVMGRSGAGKTTLIRILAGLEAPDSGEITGAREMKCAVVFQEDRLLPTINAVGNIDIAAGCGVKPALELLERFGLTDEIIYKPCNELSGGEKRRVAIARALLCSADLILMDEPFKGIDEKTLYNSVIPEVKSKASGATVVMVTHSVKEADALCGEKIVFD